MGRAGCYLLPPPYRCDPSSACILLGMRPRPCHGAARCSDYSLAVIQQVAQVGFLRRLDLVAPEHAIRGFKPYQHWCF